MCKYCSKCFFNSDDGIINCNPKRFKHDKDGELIYCNEYCRNEFKDQYKLKEEYQNNLLVSYLIGQYNELVNDINSTRQKTKLIKLKAQIDLMDDIFTCNELVEEI